MKEESHRIEYQPLKALETAARNPKAHVQRDIQKSIGRFGYVEPLIVDERTGRLVAGHGRREALIALEKAGGDPPAGIKVNKRGEWTAPVLRGWASRSDQEAEAYLLASNRLSEAGGWDLGSLADIIRELDAADAMDGLGWSDKDMHKLLGADPLPGGTGSTAADDIPEVEDRVKPGELWVMGDHRLFCADSTRLEDVARLMGGERAALMVSDPPYGVNFTDKTGKNIAADMNYGVIPGFFGLGVDNLLPGRAVLLFGAETNFSLYAALFGRELGIRPKLLFWRKPNFVLRHHDYHSQYEPIFYGWTKGGDAGTRWKGDRKQSDVWDVDFDVTTRERVHITQKPVELFAKAMRNHTAPGELCFEPFSGSGSQLIAGEKEGRRVRAMEVDPHYASVALERWEAFTGRKAVKQTAAKAE